MTSPRQTHTRFQQRFLPLVTTVVQLLREGPVYVVSVVLVHDMGGAECAQNINKVFLGGELVTVLLYYSCTLAVENTFFGKQSRTNTIRTPET